MTRLIGRFPGPVVKLEVLRQNGIILNDLWLKVWIQRTDAPPPNDPRPITAQAA